MARVLRWSNVTIHRVLERNFYSDASMDLMLFKPRLGQTNFTILAEREKYRLVRKS